MHTHQRTYRIGRRLRVTYDKLVTRMWADARRDGHGHIGNMHRKIGKDGVCDSGDIVADRQTDVFITILRHRYRGRSNHRAQES